MLMLILISVVCSAVAFAIGHCVGVWTATQENETGVKLRAACAEVRRNARIRRAHEAMRKIRRD